MNLKGSLQSVEFARILVDGGAEIDAYESQLHSTPLGWAARDGQLELCRFLLKHSSTKNPDSNLTQPQLRSILLSMIEPFQVGLFGRVPIQPKERFLINS